MFCNQIAKVLLAVGVGFACCGLIVSVILPMIMFGAAADNLSDHVDGSAITFLGGETQVPVECINANRNLPWGIWIAVTVDCETAFANIHVTGPTATAVAAVVAPAVGAPAVGAPALSVVPGMGTSQCGQEGLPSVTAAANSHVPLLQKVASFTPIMTPGFDPVTGNATETATTGTYTVNCGEVQCWVVDNRDVVAAAAAAGLAALAALASTVLFGCIGSILGCISWVLCCVSLCVCLTSEEPDEPRSKRDQLMNEDEGEDV